MHGSVHASFHGYESCLHKELISPELDAYAAGSGVKVYYVWGQGPCVSLHLPGRPPLVWGRTSSRARVHTPTCTQLTQPESCQDYNLKSIHGEKKRHVDLLNHPEAKTARGGVGGGERIGGKMMTKLICWELTAK